MKPFAQGHAAMTSGKDSLSLVLQGAPEGTFLSATELSSHSPGTIGQWPEGHLEGAVIKEQLMLLCQALCKGHPWAISLQRFLR